MLQGIFVILTAAVIFVLGYLVFIRNKTNRVNISFAFFTWVFLLYSISLFLFNQPLIFSSLFWIKFAYSLGFFLVGLIFYFSFIFPSNPPKSLKLPTILYITTVIPFLIILVFTDFFVITVIEREGINQAPLGIGFKFYAIQVSFFIGWAFVNFIRRYRKSLGLIRLQLRYFLLGFFLFAISSITTNVLLPLLDYYKYVWMSPTFSIVLVGFTSYAIIRYRLMDIRLVIKKGLAYTSSVIILILLLISIYSAVNKILGFGKIETERLTVGVIIFGIGLLFFNKLLDLVKTLLNKYLFKTLFTSKQAIEELTNKTTTIIDLDKLTFAIVDTIMKSMGLNRTGILLIDPGRENEDGIDKIRYFKTAKVVGFNENNNSFITRYPEKKFQTLASEYPFCDYLKSEKNKDLRNNIVSMQNIPQNLITDLSGLANTHQCFIPLFYYDALFAIILIKDMAHLSDFKIISKCIPEWFGSLYLALTFENVMKERLKN